MNSKLTLSGYVTPAGDFSTFIIETNLRISENIFPQKFHVYMHINMKQVACMYRQAAVKGFIVQISVILHFMDRALYKASHVAQW